MKQSYSQTNRIIAYNQGGTSFDLNNIMGQSGMLVCFTGYIWDLRCLRYVLWLQQYSYEFREKGVSMTLIVPTPKYGLSGFLVSIPQEIKFSLIADPENSLLKQYKMAKSGFILLDTQQKVVKRWCDDDALYLSIRSVLDFLQ